MLQKIKRLSKNFHAKSSWEVFKCNLETSLSWILHEKFSGSCVIFCNTTCEYDSIGPPLEKFSRWKFLDADRFINKMQIFTNLWGLRNADRMDMQKYHGQMDGLRDWPGARDACAIAHLKREWIIVWTCWKPAYIWVDSFFKLFCFWQRLLSQVPVLHSPFYELYCHSTECRFSSRWRRMVSWYHSRMGCWPVLPSCWTFHLLKRQSQSTAWQRHANIAQQPCSWTRRASWFLKAMSSQCIFFQSLMKTMDKFNRS